MSFKLHHYLKVKSWILMILVCFLFSFPEINPKALFNSQRLIQGPSLNAYASESNSQNSHYPAQWPHEKSDLQPDRSVIFGRLPNGFRYVLMQNREPKDRVSLHLNVQAGSMHETDDQQGLAHFLEHMLFDGSTHFKPGELVKFFKSIGMQWGADANAQTSFYETVYDVLLPTGNREHLQKGLTVLLDYAQGALLLESEIIKERGVVMAEKRSRDSASYRTFEASIRFEFPDARISQRLPIGREEVIKSADRRRLKDFYDTWYRPQRLVLVMVGDFDAKLAEDLIRGQFSALRPRAPAQAEFDFGKVTHHGLKTFYHHEKETGHTEVSIEVIEQIEPQVDSVALRRERLLKELADQIVQNRLEDLVRRADTPFTKAAAFTGIFLRRVHYASISAESDPENWEKALAAIEKVLRQALKYGFTAIELERVKKDFEAELENAVRKAATRSSQTLARQIIRSVNGERVFLAPPQESALLTPMLKAASSEAVHQAFVRAWSASHRLVQVSGNVDLRAKTAQPDQLIKAAYKRSKQAEIMPPEAKAAVVFPYLPDPAQEGKIVRRKELSGLSIRQIDFGNGIRLNLKETDYKADEIIVNMAFGRGRSSQPADRAGLALLAEAVVNESGLGRLNPEELQRALAGKNTRVRFNVREDRFVFSGSTIRAEVELLFQLLYAYLMDPGFRQDAYERVMQRFEQQYLSLSRSIDGALRLHGSRFLAGGDTRFGFPSFAELRQLTLKDVRTWLGTPLINMDIEVSVAGDFEAQRVVAAASKYLGTLKRKARGLAAENRSQEDPRFPIGGLLDLKVETKIPKGLIIVAYPTDDMWDIQKTRRLALLADILSERMRETIREKRGESYSPFAYNRGSRAYAGYGVLQAMVHVDPKDLAPVLTEIKGIVAELATTGVGDEELTLALKPALTGIKDLRRTNTYWLNSVMTGSKRHPQQLQWSRTLVDDYAAITAAEVSALAAQYLHSQRAAVMTIRPKAAATGP